MGALLQDARYAFRWLARNPGFAAVAILTLGLGIGTVTTIFSILDAAVLRPLPYREPDALMTVAITHQQGQAAPETFPWSSPKFASLRKNARSFDSVAGHARLDLNLTGVAEPERLVAEMVSASYFPTLGVGASPGRTFSAEEDGTPGAHPVAVISHGLWQRRFGGDRSVLGRTIEINRVPLTVVGVAAPPFSGLAGDAEIWVPMAMADAFLYPGILAEGGNHWHGVVARRKPGVSRAEAAAEMGVVGEQIARENPMEVGGAIWSIAAAPLNDSRVDPALRRSVLVLFVAVTFVLLIACANVAALMLARASTRGREVAIRVAIGAGRRRIVRQLLTESVVLALAGGVTGVLLSLWGVESLSRLERISDVGDPSFLFRFAAIALDGRVLVFAVGVSLATGLLFGMAPALHASRSDLAAALKEGGAGALGADGGSRRLTARGLLVPVQVALALVLLVGAGLMTRSLARLTGFQAGFEPEGVLTMRFDPSGVTDDDAAKAIVFRRTLLERISALPGVTSAATGRTAPLSSRHMVAIVRQVDDRRLVAEGNFPGTGAAIQIGLHDVSPDYFRTLAIPIKKGRAFTAEDRAETPKVVIINETAARRLWPGQDPIGRRVAATSFFFADGASAEVVGVAGDVLYGRPGDPQALDLYYPTFQAGLRWASLFVRTDGDPAALSPMIRREMKALAPNLPVFDISTLERRAARTFSRERFGAALLSLLAGIALFLASVGIYGLVAETVSSRTREIGVRMALGAAPGDIVRRVLRRGLALAGAGLAAGILAALGLSRLLSSLLFGVGAGDPATYAAVSALLLLVSAAACWIPARRATRVDPVTALRSE
jgi:putative ABC transport system permease protein